jgi:hypothetical protein
LRHSASTDHLIVEVTPDVPVGSKMWIEPIFSRMAIETRARARSLRVEVTRHAPGASTI